MLYALDHINKYLIQLLVSSNKPQTQNKQSIQSQFSCVMGSTTTVYNSESNKQRVSSFPCPTIFNCFLLKHSKCESMWG